MQKVLIIGSEASEGSRRGDIANAPGRFARMAAALERGGLECGYLEPPSRAELERALDSFRPDLVYCAPFATAEADGPGAPLHQLLERRGLPCVGSDADTLALALDKAALKQHWDERGVRTPAWARIRAPDRTRADPSPAVPLPSRLAGLSDFPYIVKPAAEGNSRGIDEGSVVRDPAALAARVGLVLSDFGDALVERFLGDDPGLREFTVALAGNGDSSLVMPTELGFSAPKAVRLITNDDKESHRTTVADLDDPGLRARVSDFAAAAFRAAGVRDYARGDFLLSGGELYAIEVNGQAMLPDRWFEACARGAGLDEDGCLAAVFLASLVRHRSAGRAELEPPAALAALIPEPQRSLLLGRAGKENA